MDDYIDIIGAIQTMLQKVAGDMIKDELLTEGTKVQGIASDLFDLWIDFNNE